MKRIEWAQRLGLLVFLSWFLYWPLAAQWVQVPSGCTVVVPGSSGSILPVPIGCVGDGGIVVMPDGYSGGTFSWNNVGQVERWTLLGDISLVPSGYQATTQSVSIKSFNKSVRLSESLTNPFLARSKGRVRVDYKKTPCKGTVTFDIYKHYPDGPLIRQYVPPIVGPDCWVPGERVTYSVDPVASDNMNEAIGVDQYYWEVRTPANSPDTVALYYFSGERSSITFDIPLNASCDWEIKCWFGRANPWDQKQATRPIAPHPTHSQKSGRVAPTDPFSLPNAHNLPPCLDANTTSFTASVTPPCPTLRYSWSAPYNPGVQVVTAGAQGEIVEVSQLDGNPLSLFLSITDDLGACEAKTFVHTVYRTLSPPMQIESNPRSLCLKAGEGFTLSLPPNAMNNPTTWDPLGWLQLPYNNALHTSANFEIPANTPGGTYTIEAEATNCPGVLAVDICVIPENVTIGGPDCIDYGVHSTLQFNVVAPGPGNFDFHWRVPIGWTITSTTNTNNTSVIEVDADGQNLCPLEVDICCEGTQCCGTMTKDLNFNAVQPIVTSNRTCYDVGRVGRAIFTVQNPVPGTYDWTIDPQFGVIVQRWSLPGICGKPIIDYAVEVEYFLQQTLVTNTVPIVENVASFTTLSVPQAVAVRHITPCNTSPTTVLPVTLQSPYALRFKEDFGVGELRIIPTPQPGTTYSWIRDCNLSSTLPCTTCGSGYQANPMFTQAPGYYGVVMTLPNGCVNVFCVPTTFQYPRMANPNAPFGEIGTTDSGSEIVLLPNPNRGTFELQVPEGSNAGTVVAYDGAGKKVFVGSLKAGRNVFSNVNLPSGIYLLRIVVDGSVIVKRMEVVHD